jgi:hypothetical protein
MHQSLELSLLALLCFVMHQQICPMSLSLAPQMGALHGYVKAFQQAAAACCCCRDASHLHLLRSAFAVHLV